MPPCDEEASGRRLAGSHQTISTAGSLTRTCSAELDRAAPASRQRLQCNGLNRDQEVRARQGDDGGGARR